MTEDLTDIHNGEAPLYASLTSENAGGVDIRVLEIAETAVRNLRPELVRRDWRRRLVSVKYTSDKMRLISAIEGAISS